MHLVSPTPPPLPPAPPKFCITIVFDFSWEDCNTQEKWETIGLRKIWGVNKIPYGLCENGGYIDRPCIMKEVYSTVSCRQKKYNLPRLIIDSMTFS